MDRSLTSFSMSFVVVVLSHVFISFEVNLVA